MRNILKVLIYNYVFIFSVAPSLSFANEIDSKSIKISDEDFAKEINKNTTPYENYDSSINQFDKFFGLKIDLENDDKINYKDLSITIDSKNIRILFERKLNEMTTNYKTDSNSFYSEKL